MTSGSREFFHGDGHVHVVYLLDGGGAGATFLESGSLLESR